jgi:hypothetical protein
LKGIWAQSNAWEEGRILNMGYWEIPNFKIPNSKSAVGRKVPNSNMRLEPVADKYFLRI